MDESREAENTNFSGDETRTDVIGAVWPLYVAIGSASDALGLVKSAPLFVYNGKNCTHFEDDRLETSTDHILTVLSSPPDANNTPGPLAIATDRTMSR